MFCVRSHLTVTLNHYPFHIGGKRVQASHKVSGGTEVGARDLNQFTYDLCWQGLPSSVLQSWETSHHRSRAQGGGGLKVELLEGVLWI